MDIKLAENEILTVTDHNGASNRVATVADTTLAPVYSDTPTFSEWTFFGIPEGWVINTFEHVDGFGTWVLYCQTADNEPWQEVAYGGEDAVSLAFEGSPSITATRVRTDIIGYQLGSQENKPLAALEAIQLKEWFPDGSITSISQCTSGLNHDYNATNHTATVLAFASDGTTPSNGDATGGIVIPPYVDYNGARYTVVGVGAFGNQDAPSGAQITSLKAPTTVKSVGDGAFSPCTSLTSVSLPACTGVGYDAFGACTSLASVSLPACTNVGEHAFAYCGALTSVSLPSCATVGAYAFEGCTSLTSVSLPVCTVVSNDAFGACTSLASVLLPACTGVGYYAFGSCFSLESVSLPSCDSVGEDAFGDCTSLPSVDFGPDARTSVPTLGTDAFPDLSQSGHTCRIIVPDGNYSAWTADMDWAALTQIGYVFVRHSETESAERGYVDERTEVHLPSGSDGYTDEWEFVSGTQGEVKGPNEYHAENAWEYALYANAEDIDAIGYSDTFSSRADALAVTSLVFTSLESGAVVGEYTRRPKYVMIGNNSYKLVTNDGLEKTSRGYMEADLPTWGSSSQHLEEGKVVYRVSLGVSANMASLDLDEHNWNAPIPVGDRYFKYDLEVCINAANLVSMTWPSSWVWVGGSPPTYTELNTAYQTFMLYPTVYLECRLDCRDRSTDGGERWTMVELRGIGQGHHPLG